jgi:probable rRNA maturation factor
VRVEILDETGRFRRREAVRSALAALGAELGAAGREVTVVLVDDDTIARMNAAHRGVDGPTDVLSYPLHEPDDVGMPTVAALGDVVISLDTAARQAIEHGHAPWREVLVLAAHGLMHLLGDDHPDPVAWARFEAAQARVLELIPAAPAREVKA